MGSAIALYLALVVRVLLSFGLLAFGAARAGRRQRGGSKVLYLLLALHHHTVPEPNQEAAGGGESATGADRTITTAAAPRRSVTSKVGARHTRHTGQTVGPNRCVSLGIHSPRVVHQHRNSSDNKTRASREAHPLAPQKRLGRREGRYLADFARAGPRRVTRRISATCRHLNHLGFAVWSCGTWASDGQQGQNMAERARGVGGTRTELGLSSSPLFLHSARSDVGRRWLLHRL